MRVKEEQGAPAGLEIGVNAERCGMQGRVSIPCDVHMCWWVDFFFGVALHRLKGEGHKCMVLQQQL